MVMFDPSKYKIVNYRLIVNEDPGELITRVQVAVVEDRMVPLGGCVTTEDGAFMQTMIELERIPTYDTGPR